VLLGLGLVLAPWTIRNARVFHAFIPTSVGMGELFFHGTLLATDGRWEHRTSIDEARRVVDEEVRRRGRALTAVEQDRALLRAGLETVRSHPVESAVIAVKRLWRLVFLPLSPGRLPLRLAFFVALCGLYALAIAAGLAAASARDASGAFPAALLVCLTFVIVVTAMFYTNSRYAEPFRTIPIILASGALGGRLAGARAADARDSP
jgi:hypothetical protein